MDISQFKHIHSVKVRNYEIDWQGIVHNGNYLLYFETSRVEYFKKIGMKIDDRSISGPIRFVIVRNELDYYYPATFDDQLDIYTRVSSVKNSSFVCEAIMIHAEKKKQIAANVAVMVWTDPKTGKSTPVPNEIRKLVDTYEKGNAEIFWPSIVI